MPCHAKSFGLVATVVKAEPGHGQLMLVAERKLSLHCWLERILRDGLQAGLDIAVCAQPKSATVIIT
jgi:hypothetical protein